MAHRSGDREETVVADENDVEDGSGAEEVVHHQPELTQPSAQHPFACQDVGQIHWNTKGPCGKQQTNQTSARPVVIIFHPSLCPELIFLHTLHTHILTEQGYVSQDEKYFASLILTRVS